MLVRVMQETNRKANITSITRPRKKNLAISSDRHDKAIKIIYVNGLKVHTQNIYYFILNDNYKLLYNAYLLSLR